MVKEFLNGQKKISVIGLGYVGLPLAAEFGKIIPTVGFDIKSQRVAEIARYEDSTLETTPQELKSAKFLSVTDKTDKIKDCCFHIITVPTPVDKFNKPDLRPLQSASTTVGKILKKNDVVVYESTVYPGATEEECIPLLEKFSGLKFNRDFFVGFSPERINPGDKVNTLTTIKKITSGSNAQTADLVDAMYTQIIKAGTHKAPSIKVAEAAKVIENTQRDINIAFVNELYMLFEKMGIDVNEVLEAAGTKWNFLNFSPGLVGGHCIGVDPYYLTHKAQSIGYHPEIILAGRRINDGMGAYVAEQIIKKMIKKGHKILNSKVLVMGITFKENCPDIRNTKAIDVIKELRDFGCEVDVCDPWADKAETKKEYGIDLVENYNFDDYGVVTLLVAHNQFKQEDFSKLKSSTLLFDFKNILG